MARTVMVEKRPEGLSLRAVLNKKKSIWFLKDRPGGKKPPWLTFHYFSAHLHLWWPILAQRGPK